MIEIIFTYYIYVTAMRWLGSHKDSSTHCVVGWFSTKFLHFNLFFSLLFNFIVTDGPRE